MNQCGGMQRLMIEVKVRDNNVVKAMRILKKKLEKDGLMQEIRRRQYYEKPSLKRQREHKQNLARVKKRERDKERYENLQEMTMIDYLIMKHTDLYRWTREKLNISHYGMAWISFIKGLLFGLLIALLLN